MPSRYVNTASSAGGDGTTNATSGANRAYVSLNAAEAALPANITTGGDQGVWTIICEGSAADTTAVTFSGTTTSATYYVLVTTDPEATYGRHFGVWSDTKYRLTGAGWDYKIIVSDDYTRIVGLQIQSSTNNGDGLGGVHISARTCRVSSSIIKHSGSTGSTKRGVNILWSTNCPHYIFNNIIYDFSGTGHIGINSDTGVGAPPAVFFNNTIVNCTVGLDASDDSNQGKAINNLFSGCGTAIVGTFAAGSGYNSTNNASLNYTVTGGATSDRVSQTFTFVDADNVDYHLASNDAGARDYGVSDPGSGLFSDDIDGETRSGSWDIGADEYVAAGGVVMPIFLYHYMHH